MSVLGVVLLVILGVLILLATALNGALQIYLALTLDEPAKRSTQALRSLGLSLLVLAFAPLALADPAPEEHCPVSVSSPEQARVLGDDLFEQGAYQRAGECYEAAGDHALANKAFLKAVGPRSEATKRQLSAQGDQAKALFRQVQQAFGGGH